MKLIETSSAHGSTVVLVLTLYSLCRILQVPAAYAPIDPDSPPSLSTYFMKKCDLKYVLVEKQQLSVSLGV